MKNTILFLCLSLALACKKDPAEEVKKIISKPKTILTGTKWEDKSHSWVRWFSEDTIYSIQNGTSLYVGRYTISADSMLGFDQEYQGSTLGGPITWEKKPYIFLSYKAIITDTSIIWAGGLFGYKVK